MKKLILKRKTRSLRDDQSGVAMVEFAYMLPIWLPMVMGVFDVAFFALANMQVNQIALHAADNAARTGNGASLAIKTLSEQNINDVFAGVFHEGRALQFSGTYEGRNPMNQIVQQGRARVILSSVEAVADPNPTNKFKIAWQRCSGGGTHYRSNYGTPTTTTNVDGVGPTGRQIVAPVGGSVMFVEVQYRYVPTFLGKYSPVKEQDVKAVAAMIVRDKRDLTQIYNSENATPSSSSCG
jgi:hypothetical protein